MKKLKFRSQDLRSLFENSITIEYIAEPLKAVSASSEVADVLDSMQIQDFDVVGIEAGNTITGYLERSSLTLAKSGKCGDYQQVFHPKELIAISTPLIKLLPILQQTLRTCGRQRHIPSSSSHCSSFRKPSRTSVSGVYTVIIANGGL